MAKVKVWNDNVYPHTEMFKGDTVHIPPKECIEMDWEEAIEFKGQFTGVKRLGNDQPDPAGYKMIRVEHPSEPIFKDPPLVNHASGQKFVTKKELMESLAEYDHLRVAHDPDAETPVTPTAKDDITTNAIAALKDQVEELRALLSSKPKHGFRKKA